MTDILTALGLVLVIEGLMYALLPEQMKKMMTMATAIPPDSLRIGGLVAVGAGVAFVWLAKSVWAAS